MFLRAIVCSVVVAASVTGSVAASANSQTNHPDYWGNNCVKTEMNGEVMTYNAPSGAIKVIVKGGTDYRVYDKAPFTNLTAPVNPKNGKNYAISHVIVCSDQKSTVLTPANHTSGNNQAKPDHKPTAKTAAATSYSTPEVLPEVGTGTNVVLFAALASVLGYIAHRRFLVRITA